MKNRIQNRALKGTRV